VWIDLEGDTIVVCSGTGSLKAKNTNRDPRVGLSVIAMDNPYKETQLRGPGYRAAVRSGFHSDRLDITQV
jgi:hypothetical protein